jgi:hypothetical protein
MKHLIFISIILLLSSCSKSPNDVLKEYVSSITPSSLQSLPYEITKQQIDANTTRIEFKYTLKDSIRQDDWHVTIKPSFDATFHWQPHLTPTDNHIIAQHVFRAPALIVTDHFKQLAVLPDLSLINNSDVKWYLDLDARTDELTIGVSKSAVTSHVLFERAPGLVIPPGEFKLAFYLVTSSDESDIADPWRKPLAFMWKNYGEPLYQQGQPIKGDLDPYIGHTYNWSFNTWSKSVWQEFEINNTKGERRPRVGAPVFIVNVTQSPNYTGEVNEREFRSVWNQAWFSSLRSAEGLYRYARRTNNADLLRKANMTKELALSFPQTDGLFPSVIGTEMEFIDIDGKKYKRSKGWDKRYFGNSNRNPVNPWGEAADAPYHILDMSWTANLMLIWNEELEKDQRLVDYAKRYADKLITLQDKDGFFPGWIGVESMLQTPETSMSANFLLNLYQVTKEEKYMSSAKLAMNAVMKDVVPESRWEDFETYWSCSRVLDSLVGQKIERNNAFKQNTLSMYWTADALLNFYKVTGEEKYLKTGQRVVDQMLMYQSTWQPPYIPIPVLGGFGVMNADGEWNDSRQCLFAETIVRYGQELENDEYIHRGLSALRSAFVMMYCPENPETKAQWEKVYPFFNEKDYGFMMENYGHGGENNAEGLGIGEFTIYDWGNGAAAESYNTMKDRYPELF